MGEFADAALGGVIELKRGYDLPQQDRIPGVVPIVSSSGVIAHHFKGMVRGPGVVTGRYGTLGLVFYVAEDFWPLNTTLYVRDFKGNNPRFIYYFLQSLDFNAYSDKAAVPGLNRNHLHLAPVRYPVDIIDQRAIANILGALDDKIDLNRRMNETLEAMARAIFKDWFVDFGPTRAKIEDRAPYLAPEVWALFPARLDDDRKPEGWINSTIGQEVEVIGGSTPSTREPRFWGGSVAWATPKDLSSLSSPVLLETERKITETGLAQISSGLLPVGTVLLSSRAPIGYIAVALVPTAVNQGFIAMICRNRISSVFAWLWTQANMEAIHQKANGSTFQEISKANFRPIPVIVAPDAVNRAFDHVARPLLDRIICNERENRSLAATRDLLLPKLMSGEIRVRDAEKIAERAA